MEIDPRPEKAVIRKGLNSTLKKYLSFQLRF